MISLESFNFIKNKYQYWSSWAIWAEAGDTPKSNVGDLSVLDPKKNPNLLSQLNPNIVLVALSLSRGHITLPFANFHDSRSEATDFKIRYATQNTLLWGAYITDIIKDSEGKFFKERVSRKFLKENREFEKEHTNNFVKELSDIGANNPKLIAFGNDTFDILKRNLQEEFEIYKIPSYANYTGKEKYREQVAEVCRNISKNTMKITYFPKVKRNPKWIEEEIILALDFYYDHYPSIPDKSSIEISELSKILNELYSIHSNNSKTFSKTFRNNNGVYMKLMNFHALNPNHKSQGLLRGGKLEKNIWNSYSSNRSGLKIVAKNIRSFVLYKKPLPEIEMNSDEEYANEGKILTRVHRYRERNEKIKKAKKNSVLKKTGKLSCEVCDFNFKTTYGERGREFIECHHNRPVSELMAGEKTKLRDLSLLCSNCHSMIHAKRPWLTIHELKEFIISN